MFVGSLRLVIHIPAAQSLKDRRRVVLKLKDRLRARLRVSVCELGDADRHQIAVLGIATVARDATSCRRVLEEARQMANTLGDAWLTDANGEVASFGGGGTNLRGGVEAFSSSGIVDADTIAPSSGHLRNFGDLLDEIGESGDIEEAREPEAPLTESNRPGTDGRMKLRLRKK